MEIEIERIEDIIVATLSVESIYVNNAEEFKRAFSALLIRNTKVVLDLRNVGFVDSSGFGVILACTRKVAGEERTLKLCCLSKPVLESCQLVGIHKVLEIFNTRWEAIAAFPKSND